MVSMKEIRERLRLDALDLPARPVVRRIEPAPYVNWLGDEECLVVVELDEATTDDERSWHRLKPIYDLIHSRMRELEDAPYPYVRFGKRSELEEGP